MPSNSTITVLQVDTDMEKSTYTVKADKGSSVNEMAFATMVVIRTLVRDKLIQSATDFITLVKKYLDDPQYDEVKHARNDN